MQKFYSQMTEHEVRDRMLNKTLSVLEAEVQRLSAKANELEAENEVLKVENETQRREIDTLRSENKQIKDATAEERWNYAQDLEEFSTQLTALKSKISRNDSKSVRKLPSKRSTTYLQQIADMRVQLNHLSSSILSPRSTGKASPKRVHLSPTAKSGTRTGSSNSGATSPTRLQSEVEEMIRRIEGRLKRAKELTQKQE